MLHLQKSNYCAASLLVLFGLMVGCGGPSQKSYIPSSNLARDAIDEVLKEWQAGASYATLNGLDVPVEVFVTRWKSGKKLESYEILQEEPSEHMKIFVVKMKLADEKEESERKFIVYGRNPVFVYDEEDYNRPVGM